MRKAASALPEAISVQLKCGSRASVQPLWLRLNDPSRFTPNGQRLFEISDVVRARPAVASTSTDAEGCLRVEWADGETSVFSNDWLAAHVLPDAVADAAPGTQAPYLWNARFETFLPEVCFETHFAADGAGSPSEGRLLIASHLERYGIAVLRRVPAEEGMVKAVANEAGFLRNTNYGEVFDVIDRGAEGNNLAQTNVQILSHTDNPYRDPFPGVQLLHCLTSADEGGATTFVDGFACAERLRRERPDAFALLAEHEMPYEYSDPEQEVLLRARVPVLSTCRATGAVQRIAFNNRSAACKDFGRGLSAETLEAYFEAWAAFDTLCNSSEFRVRVPLRPGDLAVFSNSRVMHGREAYEPGAPRHIQGAYLDHDATRSRVRAAEARGSRGSGPRWARDIEGETPAVARAGSDRKKGGSSGARLAPGRTRQAVGRRRRREACCEHP
jgi:gamma-butyrobetaine dioxygenase